VEKIRNVREEGRFHRSKLAKVAFAGGGGGGGAKLTIGITNSTDEDAKLETGKTVV